VFYALGLLLLVAGVFLLVLGARLYGQPTVGEQISYYPYKLPLPGEPPQRFYTRLYQAFNTSLQDRLPDGDSTPVEVVLTGMGFGPHRLFAAHSLFAERPLYLLVRYKHLRYYIYAGQSPTGLFISAWGYNDYQSSPSELERLLPVLRALKYFKRQTLFQYDAALMFIDSVQGILCETLNACLQEKGLKPLEEMEKRPILHAFYQNPFYRDRFFGQGGSDLHSHVDLFHSSSRTATSGVTPDPASANSNGHVPQAASPEMNESDTAPQTNHAAPHAAPQAAPAVNATPPVPPSVPPSTPTPSTPPPRPPLPPRPQPLFPMDQWLADGQVKESERTETLEDGEKA
jgi:hypothetical protein